MASENEIENDTDPAVGLIVRRIKAELEMHRAQQEDMVRRVVREELADILKKIRDAVTFFFSQTPKK